jgi:hypothetical protein
MHAIVSLAIARTHTLAHPHNRNMHARALACAHRSPYGELLLVTGPATTHVVMVGGKAVAETVLMRWVYVGLRALAAAFTF